THRGELQNSRQGDHVLRYGVVVPIQRGVRRRLLELNRLGLHEGLAADAAAHHMRVPIWTGEKAIGSDHFASMTLTSLMCRISAESARPLSERAAFSISDSP